MTTPPNGAPETIGEGQYVNACGVGIGMDLDSGQHFALMLDLFADTEGQQRLHDVPYLLHPYLAGLIVAGLVKRCRMLGPEAQQQLQLGMAAATEEPAPAETQGEQELYDNHDHLH